MIKDYESFGRYPKVEHSKIIKLFWRSDVPEFKSITGKILPYGLGKSYGDSCLNEGHVLINTRGLNKFISFDDKTGILRCESGVTLSECIDFLLPRGYFLPVTPGTKYITLGGAVANDVHGKNHHKAGTFGCHVTQFELLRSDGHKNICSLKSNPDLFSSTIGGLGLTGLITWVEFKAIRVHGPIIDMESIKFKSFEEFFEINTESNLNYDYTVAWVNVSKPGHGIYMRGTFANSLKQKPYNTKINKQIPFPLEIELINPLTVKLFNMLYEGKQFGKVKKAYVDINPFFYPLDAVDGWNKVYGKKGFLQYQFVIPFDNYLQNLKEIFSIIKKSGMSSFLTVLKTFGDVKSPGMLSFPKPGVTLAIDFKMTGERTLTVLETADKIVRNAGGILYPAKDARMASEDFKKFYPNWKKFSQYIDPKFSSSFWRRVTK
jgi:FAD/FMN-containing dehydrogenase